MGEIFIKHLIKDYSPEYIKNYNSTHKTTQLENEQSRRTDTPVKISKWPINTGEAHRHWLAGKC